MLSGRRPELAEPRANATVIFLYECEIRAAGVKFHNFWNENAQPHHKFSVEIFGEPRNVGRARRIRRPHPKTHDLRESVRRGAIESAALAAEAESF